MMLPIDSDRFQIPRRPQTGRGRWEFPPPPPNRLQSGQKAHFWDLLTYCTAEMRILTNGRTILWKTICILLHTWGGGDIYLLFKHSMVRHRAAAARPGSVRSTTIFVFFIVSWKIDSSALSPRQWSSLSWMPPPPFQRSLSHLGSFWDEFWSTFFWAKGSFFGLISDPPEHCHKGLGRDVNLGNMPKTHLWPL